MPALTEAVYDDTNLWEQRFDDRLQHYKHLLLERGYIGADTGADIDAGADTGAYADTYAGAGAEIDAGADTGAYADTYAGTETAADTGHEMDIPTKEKKTQKRKRSDKGDRVVKMTFSHIRSTSIPRFFRKMNDKSLKTENLSIPERYHFVLRDVHKIYLSVKSSKWVVDLQRRGKKGISVSKGWKNFVSDNKILAGYICLFEIRRDSEDKIYFDVEIVTPESEQPPPNIALGLGLGHGASNEDELPHINIASPQPNPSLQVRSDEVRQVDAENVMNEGIEQDVYLPESDANVIPPNPAGNVISSDINERIPHSPSPSLPRNVADNVPSSDVNEDIIHASSPRVMAVEEPESEEILNSHIEKTLWNADQIAKKVSELAAEITKDFPTPSSLPVFVGIATGAFRFLGDLVCNIKLPITVDQVRAESCCLENVPDVQSTFSLDLKVDIKDQHVILVEDIVETGHTLCKVIAYMRSKGASSVSVCALLSKPKARKVLLEPVGEGKIYYGFECLEDYLLVGYGMDHAELYRNLPYIGVLKSDNHC